MRCCGLKRESLFLFPFLLFCINRKAMMWRMNDFPADALKFACMGDKSESS